MPRQLRRQNYTEEEIHNLNNGRCWCGKPRSEFEKYQRKYCSKKHADIWHFVKAPHYTINISAYYNWRMMLRKESTGRFDLKCDNCGAEGHAFEVDHRVAIMNGGDTWNWHNLQILCSACHEKKTKQDHYKKKLSKKQEGNMTLSSFVHNIVNQA